MLSATSRLAALASLACVALAGCGGGDEDEASTSESVEPAEFAIYDWEGNLVADPALSAPAENGYASPPELEGVGGKLIVVRDETDPENPRFYALRDKPALTGTDITDPEVVLDPATGEPSIVVRFTPDGVRKFEALTRLIAERARDRADPAVIGPASAAASDHFAVVVDKEVLALPLVNFAENPAGIDGRNGAQITGGFTQEEAEQLVERIAAGN